MSLKDRVVVITGAARGMGQAYVQGFLAEGARIVAIDLSWEDDDFTRGLRTEEDVLMLTADVTDGGQLDRAYQSALQTFGTVDVLINNAGMRMRNVVPVAKLKVLESDKTQWERMFAANVLGQLELTRRFIQPMIQQRRGSVIMVSSGSGARGRAEDQPYGASKAALTNLSQSLADEVREYNVAVNVIFPGSSRTTGYDEQTQLRRASGLAVERLPVKPESVVPVALYLAQQDASGETGQVFRAIEWNEAHGLGGYEAWVSPDPKPA